MFYLIFTQGVCLCLRGARRGEPFCYARLNQIKLQAHITTAEDSDRWMCCIVSRLELDEKNVYVQAIDRRLASDSKDCFCIQAISYTTLPFIGKLCISNH